MSWFRRVLWKIKKYNSRSKSREITLKSKILEGEFPTNTKFVGNNGHSKIIIVEAPPGKRILFSSNMYASGWMTKPICLYFPYVYFIFKYYDSITPDGNSYVLSQMYVGFADERAESSDSMVGHLPLTNRLSGYTFCLGIAGPVNGPYCSVADLTNTHIDSFWKSSFVDLRYKEWSKATESEVGDLFVRYKIKDKIQIYDLMSLKNEQFFDYQVSKSKAEAGPKPNAGPKPKPKPEERSQSRNRRYRRKRRQNSAG